MSQKLTLVVDEVLSISGYDWGNVRIQCKQEYCIKNVAVKILL